MLAFGAEAVIPIEIGLPMLRIEELDEDSNSFRMRANQDPLEEIRKQARVWMANYQQKIIRYYNSRVKSKSFLVG